MENGDNDNCSRLEMLNKALQSHAIATVPAFFPGGITLSFAPGAVKVINGQPNIAPPAVPIPPNAAKPKLTPPPKPPKSEWEKATDAVAKEKMQTTPKPNYVKPATKV